MKKIIFLLAVMLSVFSTGYAQVSGYTFSQSTGNTYTEITGGTVVISCTDCTETHDTGSWAITLPTPLSFNGVPVSSVVMRADGSLVMGTSELTSATGPLAATTTGVGVISPLGMNLRSSTVAGSTYELRWQEFADSYTFQWKNAARLSQNTTESLNFQVSIHKTTGVVTMNYGSMTVANSTTYQPVVGLRGFTNTDFINRRLTTAIPDASPSWDDTAVGTTNSQTVRFTSGTTPAVPASGLTFTWTPPTCFGPSAVSHTAFSDTTATLSWTASTTAPASGYEYYVSTATTDPDATTIPTGVAAGTSVALTALTPDTVYNYWVRSNCGGGIVSTWVPGTSFRTDCSPITPPTALELFSDYTGSIPALCWREAKGVLSATPISLTGTTSTWGSSAYNNVTGGANGNGNAAHINLDGVDDDWIISPTFNLGTGSTDYQIEYTASVVFWTGTDVVTTMDEKYVKVVISTDGGQTWSDANVIQTYDNTNIPAGGVNAIVSLAAYSGNVKIGFYGHSVSADGVDLRFYIDNFRIIPIPSCLNPGVPTVSAIGETTATLTWTAATPAPANGYQYYVNTTGTAPTAATTATGSVGAGILTANLTALTPGVTQYAWIRSNCGSGAYSEWIAAASFNTLCDAFEILTSAATTVCGQGTSTLTATATGGTIEWYAAANGGVALATGGTYTTPVLTAPTTYYTTATTILSTITGGARVAPAGILGTTPSNYGLVFDAYTSFTINTVDVYLKGTAAGTVVIVLQDNTGAQLQTISVPVPAGNVDAPVQHTINLGFNVPAGTGYRLLAVSGPSMVRESGLGGFPYAIGTAGSVTNGYISGTSTAYYYFYNWSVVASCAAPRVPVTVNVTAAPAIEATVSDNTICVGESTNLNVSSANTGYTYVWMPGNLTGAAQTVNPALTTTYTVTATDAVSGCITTDEVTVAVNSLPAAVTITNSATGALCAGQVATLSAGGSTPNPVIGTGTAVNTATGVPSPYSLYYGGNKYQMLVRASELNALGYTTGSQISAIAFNVSAVGASFGGTLENFQIDMGHTADNVLNATAFVTGLTNYLPAGTVAIPTTGLPANVTHTFTTPFVWNGVDNIVVQTSFSNNIAGTSAQTVQMTYSPAGFAATSYYRDDEATAAFILAEQDPASTSNNRPNMIFTATNPAVVWSPATNLYTDTAATVPYVSGAAASTVYVKSSTAGTTAYTATRTTAQGCSTSATVNITVNAETPVPVASALTFCNASPTVANLTATGTNLQWYAALTGGTALVATTPLATGSYYVSQTINGCESARTEVAVTVNTTAAPTASALTFCNASPTVANLTATGTSLQWYAAATGGTALVATTALTSGNYYVSQTINGCESPRTEVAVTVNVTAAPTASALTFCNASPTVANLTATGTGLQWYAAATGGTALEATTALISGNYYVSQTINGCESARTEVAVTVNTTAAPVVTDAVFCNATPTVADLASSATGTALLWYADVTGGTALASTTPLVAGNYYVSQTINGCESPRATVAVTLNTTVAPTVTDFTFCNESPTVADLTATGTALQWYADVTGGVALTSATALTAGTYFVSQTVNGCESPRASVNVTINTTTAPVAAAAQTFCVGATVADIDVTGTATQWYSTQTGDNPIALTTEITDGTIYYVSQIINGCESSRTAVTATVITVTAQEIADQVVCSEYVLPALTAGNYFTATNGGGTQLAAGTAIIVDSEIFIFVQAGDCTDETSFTVDVTPVDAITGEATQLISVNDLADATIEDLVVTAAGTVIWYPTAADAAAGTNPIAAGTQLVNGENYFAVQTVGTCTSAAFEVTATVALGREDFNLGNIKYYPNPVVDKLTVSFSSNITQVEVYNLLGQLVIAQQPNATTAEVNMARLEAATYIVKVTADGKSKTFKVVKNN
jgi:hypothetical protein